MRLRPNKKLQHFPTDYTLQLFHVSLMFLDIKPIALPYEVNLRSRHLEQLADLPYQVDTFRGISWG